MRFVTVSPVLQEYIDECLEDGFCSHNCTHTPRRYSCSCLLGYQLVNKSCQAEDQILFTMASGRLLLTAFQERNHELIISLAAKNKSRKKKEFNFVAALKTISDEDLEILWVQIQEVVEELCHSTFGEDSPYAKVAESHTTVYEAFYQQVDPTGTDCISATEALAFLKHSGLPDTILSKIYAMSDPQSKGFLDKQGFFEALKLISLQQHGKDLSAANMSLDELPPPMNFDVFNRVVLAAIQIANAGLEENIAFAAAMINLGACLNASLPHIPDYFDELKNGIAQLCERLYPQDWVQELLEGKRWALLSNVLQYLLLRSLSPKATKADVVRVSLLSDIFPKILTMKEYNGKETFKLLRQCAVNKLYLQIPEGQKVICNAFKAGSSYTYDIYNIIKSQLPSCRVKTAEAYGKIFFNTWLYAVESNSADLKVSLEIVCFGGFIELGVKAKKHFPSIQQFLKQIQKSQETATCLLFEHYQYWLWPYLKSYYAEVRANAAHLLFDIFPIPHPSRCQVKIEQHLIEQLLMIKDLLEDNAAAVRLVTVIRLLNAMNVIWEIFPEEMLKTYLRIIVEERRKDSSSKVRCAVDKGMKVLMKNPLLRQNLLTLLPSSYGH